MKFGSVKQFTGTTLEDVLLYLQTVLPSGFSDLFAGLNSLKVDNFSGFTWEGEINPSATVTITNPLGAIPSGRLILRATPVSSGTVFIDDSLTQWTGNAVYLRNTGTVKAKVKALFLR